MPGKAFASPWVSQIHVPIYVPSEPMIFHVIFGFEGKLERWNPSYSFQCCNEEAADVFIAENSLPTKRYYAKKF